MEEENDVKENLSLRGTKQSNQKSIKLGLDMKQYYLYIITNKENGTIYTGVTNDLVRRIGEHKKKQVLGFTNRHGLDKLVYFEVYQDVKEAIKREKQLKGGSRLNKLNLINAFNKNWDDLYEQIC